MKTFLTSGIILITLLMGCGSSTKITGSYKAPDQNTGGYKKVFVAALTSNVPARQKIETTLAGDITRLGMTAVRSLDVAMPTMDNSNKVDPKQVLDKVKENNCDAILTVALINKETESRYVPGSAYPAGAYGYYGTFGGYYGNWYGSLYSPGYYTTDKTYYIETNLYDVKSEKLVWSAQSQTYNPSSIDDFLKGYQDALAKQAQKDGLIATPAK